LEISRSQEEIEEELRAFLEKSTRNV